MPEFLQSSFLFGAAAIAVPVLIHLFFRLKTKRVDLGTIRFLRIVLEENARRRKVMRWFLLALRMVLIALLAGLFARPFLSAAAVQGDGELLVILIDQSATMQLKGEHGRLLDQAVSDAQRLLTDAGERARFEVAFFDFAVHPLGAQKNADDRNQPLNVPQAANGATNYGAAIAWARDICIKAPEGPKELHLFTDLQQSGLDWTDVEAFPVDVKVHLHDLGQSVVNNLAVTDVRTPRSWIRPGETAAMRASVLHGGAFAREEVGVVLEVGRVPLIPKVTSATPTQVDFSKLTDRITFREKAKLEPGATVTLDFDLPALAEGVWQGRVLVDANDDLAFDNERYFAISATPAYHVLIVDNGVGAKTAASETYFLEASLRLADPGETYAESPFAPTTMSLSELERLPRLTDYSAVILANVPKVSSEDAAALAEFVKRGGGLLVFTGEQTTQEAIASLQQAGLAAGTVGETKIAVDLPWRFQQWDEHHPIYQSLSDPQHGDLRRMAFAAYTPIKPSDGADVIAEFNTGDPAVIERRVGQGTVLWVTTSCGREWSDWCQTSLYLPLMHQWLGYEVGLTAGGRVRNSILDANPEATDGLPTLSSQTDRGVSPLASSIPGVWFLPDHVAVINPSPRESETERCPREEFETRFALKFVSDDGTADPSSELQATELRRDEIWHWVACALLGVLLLEGFVGNRTTA
ncbi:MAG TPA: BatA domain-containing protein [Planctomycetaceae bacterium]|nr:BatA domain-containing protein [Planctomycetaceae bacterium]